MPELEASLERAQLSEAAQRSAEKGLTDLDDALSADAYWRAPASKRVAVIFAGPFANFVFCIVAAGRRLHARRAGGRDPDGRPRHRRIAGRGGRAAGRRRDRRGRRRADEELRRRARRHRGQQGRPRRADGSPGRRARRAATGGAGADRRPLSHRLHSRSVLPGLLRRAGDREGVRADGRRHRRNRSIAGRHRHRIDPRRRLERRRDRRAVGSGRRGRASLLPGGARADQPLPGAPEPPPAAPARRRAHRVLDRGEDPGRAIPRVAYERASVIGIALVLLLFFIGLSNDINRLRGG